MIILKILSVFSLIFLVILSFTLGSISLLEGKHLFDPYIDTTFATNYSPEKFEKIEIGMTVNDVIKIVGEPLRIGQSYKDTLNKTYDYTKDGKNHHGDFAWYNSSLEIDTNKRVIFIYKGWNYD